ncbi:MAG TPA: hypothetical protein VJB98_00440 [Candidatus Paceibacterota bacterium]
MDIPGTPVGSGGIRTSFIPKTSLSARPPRKEGLGFFTFLSLTVLVVSLLGWLAAYSYNSLVAKKVSELETFLTRARESFDPALLKVFENLERRLTTAENLLEAHSSVGKLFDVLNERTLKSVRYTYFSYVNNGTAAAVKMSGEAIDFPSVALQALEYSKDDKLINPIFSNLGVEEVSDTANRVTFDVSFNIDPALVMYTERQRSALEGI